MKPISNSRGPAWVLLSLFASLVFVSFAVIACSQPLRADLYRLVSTTPVFSVQSMVFASPNNSPPSLSFQAGVVVAQTVAVSFTPANATNKAVTWSSANGKVTITPTGPSTATVTPITGTGAPIAGDTDTITATPVDGGSALQKTCTVVFTGPSSTPVTSISLDHSSLSIVAGATAILKATTSPPGATDSTVTWTSDDAGAALVSGSHTGDVSQVTVDVKSLPPGTVFHVKAASNEDPLQSAVCTVTVTAPVTSLTLNSGAQMLLTAENFPLVASVSPPGSVVTWSVSPAAPGVATVDQSGVVTAVGPGSATVVASAGNFTASCLVTVGGWQAPLGGGTIPSVSASGVKMAIDSTGKPYVAYVDGGGAGQLLVFDGSSWVPPGGGSTFSTSVVTPNTSLSPYPTFGVQGSNIAMAIDSGNNVYVAFPEIVGGVTQLTIRKNDGTAWSTVGDPRVEAFSNKATGEPRYLSMAASGTNLFLAFADGGAGIGGAAGNTFGATILNWNGTAWSIVGFRGGTNSPELYLSLAINPSGQSILAAVNNGSFEAYQGNSVIGFGYPHSPTATQPSFLSLAIDSHSNYYVGYQSLQNSGQATVILSTPTTPQWSYFTSAIGTGAVSSGQASYVTMAIGGGDTPFVGFQDAANGNTATVLKFNGTAWVSMGTNLSPGAVTDLTIAADPNGPGLFLADVDGTGAVSVRRLQ